MIDFLVGLAGVLGDIKKLNELSEKMKELKKDMESLGKKEPNFQEMKEFSKKLQALSSLFQSAIRKAEEMGMK